MFRGEEGSTPRASRHKDPDSSTLFCFHSSHLFIQVSVLREGGVGKRMAETPLPHHTPGTRQWGRRSTKESPKTGDVCNHSVPLGTGAGIVEHRQIEK